MNGTYDAERLVLLELVSFASANAAQVAAALQVHPRTARRILRQLETSEWVQSRPASGTSARTWEPTLRLVALAGQLVRRHPLAVAADATLAALKRETSPEHAAVVTPAYRDTVTIAGANGGAGGLFGALAPAHASAGGKALLAGRERGEPACWPLARTAPLPIRLPSWLSWPPSRREGGRRRTASIVTARSRSQLRCASAARPLRP